MALGLKVRLQHKPGKSAENNHKILKPVFNQPIKICSCLPCLGQETKIQILAFCEQGPIKEIPHFPLPLPLVSTTVFGVMHAVHTLSGQISKVLQPFRGVYLFSRNDSSEN